MRSARHGAAGLLSAAGTCVVMARGLLLTLALITRVPPDVKLLWTAVQKRLLTDPCRLGSAGQPSTRNARSIRQRTALRSSSTTSTSPDGLLPPPLRLGSVSMMWPRQSQQTVARPQPQQTKTQPIESPPTLAASGPVVIHSASQQCPVDILASVQSSLVGGASLAATA